MIELEYGPGVKRRVSLDYLDSIEELVRVVIRPQDLMPSLAHELELKFFDCAQLGEYFNQQIVVEKIYVSE